MKASISERDDGLKQFKPSLFLMIHDIFQNRIDIKTGKSYD